MVYYGVYYGVFLMDFSFSTEISEIHHNTPPET